MLGLWIIDEGEVVRIVFNEDVGAGRAREGTHIVRRVSARKSLTPMSKSYAV